MSSLFEKKVKTEKLRSSPKCSRDVRGEERILGMVRGSHI